MRIIGSDEIIEVGGGAVMENVMREHSNFKDDPM